MDIQKLRVNPSAARFNVALERVLNGALRRYDGLLSRVHLGGRKARYDDAAYEFYGGARDSLRKKHYDKSLRLLWKAEQHAPWLGFHDASTAERSLLEMATRALTDEEREARRRLSQPEYRALLNREYTPRQKRAIVSILSAIGHGEAYAWLVSAELLGEVQSTGARAALTMQVVEEAKHFVVLRELLQAFEVPIPRQSAWEYMLLEGVHKSKGLEKFFGMNVVVEGIALGLFGSDERHARSGSAAPVSLGRVQAHRVARELLPRVPLEYLAKAQPNRSHSTSQLDPAGAGTDSRISKRTWRSLAWMPSSSVVSVVRKVSHLAERNGFMLTVPRKVLLAELNLAFNAYCKLTRPKHAWRNFMKADTTRGSSGTRRSNARSSLATPLPSTPPDLLEPATLSRISTVGNSRDCAAATDLYVDLPFRDLAGVEEEHPLGVREDRAALREDVADPCQMLLGMEIVCGVVQDAAMVVQDLQAGQQRRGPGLYQHLHRGLYVTSSIETKAPHAVERIIRYAGSCDAAVRTVLLDDKLGGCVEEIGPVTGPHE